jgi:hypothetical protein
MANVPDLMKYAQKSDRFRTFYALLTLPVIIGFALHIYFTIIEFTKQPDPGTKAFTPFGWWDFAGRFIQFAAPAPPSDFRAIFGTFVYITSIIFVSVAALILMGAVLETGKAVDRWRARRYARVNSPQRDNPKAAPASTEGPPPPNEEASVEPQSPPPTTRQYLTMRLIDFVSGVLILTAVVYSYDKLRSGLVDFASIGHMKYEVTMLVAWCYFTIILLAFVLIGFKNFTLASLWKPKDPFMVVPVWQMTVMPLLMSLFLFGAVVFPRLPFALGGGQPRLVDIKFKAGSVVALQGPVYLIGESTQYFFAVTPHANDKRAYQLSKDIIESLGSTNVNTHPEVSEKKGRASDGTRPLH